MSFRLFFLLLTTLIPSLNGIKVVNSSPWDIKIKCAGWNEGCLQAIEIIIPNDEDSYSIEVLENTYLEGFFLDANHKPICSFRLPLPSEGADYLSLRSEDKLVIFEVLSGDEYDANVCESYSIKKSDIQKDPILILNEGPCFVEIECGFKKCLVPNDGKFYEISFVTEDSRIAISFVDKIKREGIHYIKYCKRFSTILNKMNNLNIHLGKSHNGYEVVISTAVGSEERPLSFEIYRFDSKGLKR